MHIIIPMSGVGQRFIDAGYSVPKPLIEIDGKPIIEHVVNLFSPEDRFTFICNRPHLETTTMRAELERICPNGTIVSIEPHKKGPVYAVNCIAELIDPEEEVIVNYCDFGTYWDYQDFLSHTRSRKADGAVVAYRGFHPHMMGSTNYAFMRESDQWMLEIKEKEPFTDDRLSEFASNGTYYFRTGALMLEAFKAQIAADLSLNGEYYVSLAYNCLKEMGHSVSIYKIQHMLQWGTPQDVAEYNSWSHLFRDLATQSTPQAVPSGTLVMPMAGKGQRFRDQGYTTPKPLLPVSGRSMIEQAALSLPPTQTQVFVALADHLETSGIAETLSDAFPQSEMVPLSAVTEGQAVTCEKGVAQVADDSAIHIGACDTGLLYDATAFAKTAETADAVIWTFRGTPQQVQNPTAYGWVESTGDTATNISVKVPISESPGDDPAIVGVFSFASKAIFQAGYEALIAKNHRVNGEFYVDSLMQELIDLGYQVKIFDIQQYVGWGTPVDYESFRYWQSFFHKCEWHPYTIAADGWVPNGQVTALDADARQFAQEAK